MTQCEDLRYGVKGRWDFDRCVRCHTIFMNPLPAAHEIAAFYPTGYFTHGSTNNQSGALSGASFRTRVKMALWEERFGYTDLLANSGGGAARAIASVLGVFPPVVKKLGTPLRFVPFRSGGRLLDLGCGNGDFLQFARNLSWQVEGLEPDPNAAAIVRAAGIPVEIGTVDTVDFPEDRFDAITLSHVLEHFVDPANSLRRIVRWLKPGGTLVTITPNPCSTVAEPFGRYWYSLDAPRHLVLPSPNAVRTLIESASLRARVFTLSYRNLEIARASARRASQHGAARFSRYLSHSLYKRVTASPENASGEDVVCIGTKPAR